VAFELSQQTGVKRPMAFKPEPHITEWTAPRIKFEDFVKRAEWHELPLAIRLGVVHIWQREQEMVAPAEHRAIKVEAAIPAPVAPLRLPVAHRASA
jgi:hypothetical protein